MNCILWCFSLRRASPKLFPSYSFDYFALRFHLKTHKNQKLMNFVARLNVNESISRNWLIWHLAFNTKRQKPQKNKERKIKQKHYWKVIFSLNPITIQLKSIEVIQTWLSIQSNWKKLKVSKTQNTIFKFKILKIFKRIHVLPCKVVIWIFAKSKRLKCICFVSIECLLRQWN